MSETTTEALVTIRAAVDAGRAAEERLLGLVEKLRSVAAERDALRLQVGELKLALQGAQSEVAQLRWERAGSPMPGETPTDG